MPYSLKTFVSIFLFIYLSSFNASFAQNFLWAKRAGGNSIDYSSAIASDNLGNVVVAGYFDSPYIAFGNTGFTNTVVGNYDAYLAKYNGDGALLWAIKIGNSENQTVSSICTDNTNNIIVVGRFEGSTFSIGNITLNNNGWDDLFIAKFNPNGNLIWAKAFGGSQVEYANSVTTDFNNDILLCGNFASPTITFGNNTLNNQGSYDIFIAKLSQNGNVLWSQSIGGIQFEVDAYVKSTINGEIVISGSFASPSFSFQNTTLTSAGLTDIFIAKLTPNGDLIWIESEGDSGYEFNNSIDVDQNGNIFNIGNFKSPTIIIGSDTLFNNGDYDIIISKYNSNGDPLWAKSSGGDNIDSGNSIVSDNNGNLFAAVSYWSPTISCGNFYFTNNGGSDMILMKLDQNGNTVWAQSHGGNDSDYTISMDLDVADNLLIAGYFSSQPLTLGTINLNNAGNSDVFLAKIDAASITNANEINIDEFSIFPNPASNEINIQTNSNLLNEPFKIIDNIGKTVYSGTIQSATTTISLELLESGCYSVIVGGNECKKLIKL